MKENNTSNGKHLSSITKEDKDWPENKTNFLSRWTYSYLNQLLSDGAKTTLTMEHLWDIPPELVSPDLLQKFNSLQAKKPLWKKLLIIVSPVFVPAGLFQLVTIACQCSLPLLGRQLIKLLEDSHEDMIRLGIMYAVLIFIVTTINGVAANRHLFLAMQSGMMVRTTVVSAVYSIMLKLNPKGKIGLSSGEVTNLVAVDSQKLYEVIQDGHLVWSCPFSMFIVMILLLYIQGPVTILGMFVLILLVPATKVIVSRMQKARKMRVKYSDERTQITSAMINGIQVTKLNSYEPKFEKKIAEKRLMEMKYLRKELIYWVFSLALVVSSPILATGASFILYVLIDERNILTASDTFTTLMLFSALRFPIMLIGRLVGRLGQSIQALQRISKFLEREVHKDCDLVSSEDIPHNKEVVSVKNGEFQIFSSSDTKDQTKEEDQTNSTFKLKDINFSLCRGDILAVVGPVGSGKSTLALSLLGEIPRSVNTSLNVKGRLGYSSQLPFILNATFRDNILFGLDYDPIRYEKVIGACCLRSDIESLEYKDMTEIGERGITLSGGQKQRLSIARTVYSQPDVAIFDDPLSALDAGTSRAVCERLFLNKDENGLLSSTAVMLVTHSAYFLHEMDKIMILENGESTFYGSWSELIKTTDKHKSEFIESLTKDLQEKRSDKDHKKETNDANKRKVDGNAQESNKDGKNLMTIEDRERGISSIATWLLWFQGAGGVLFVLMQILFLTTDRVAYVATEWWLAQWTEASKGPVTVFGMTLPSQFDGMEAQIFYVTVYSIIIFISVGSTMIRTVWAVFGGIRCAYKLFDGMTLSVLQAPMSFFETTPLGRILNRFTYDTEVLDVQLTQSMASMMISIGWFIAGVGVMTGILPWLILVIIPIMIMFTMLQLHYRKSSVDLQRLDAVSRSPLQTTLSEVIDGAITMRVFGQEKTFTSKFFNHMDTNNKSMLTFIAAHKWIGVRLEVLSGIIQIFAFSLVVILEKSSAMQPGLAAMLIIWATNFTITLNYLVLNTSEAEAAIVSIERINAMSSLPQEKHEGEVNVPPSWPRKGSLRFEDVYMRYREDLPYALKGLNLELPAGKRCGVIGRTGAGKSSLAVALFRLVEIQKGKISLDEIDLSDIKLSEIRGRSGCMSIIPQDPVLFAGSIRDCLDPFNEWPDADILDALRAVRLLKDGRGVEALKDHVEEGGNNFSVGERQLLCLARALLAKPKFLVLDEATASVDGETDAFIQNMLRTRFDGCTLLTIAHRLNTIMDYDLIIAMDDGKVAEMGSPSSLLEKKNGVFSQFVDATGEESAKLLRSMIKV